MHLGRRSFNLDVADECSELMEEDDFDEVCLFLKSACLAFLINVVLKPHDLVFVHVFLPRKVTVLVLAGVGGLPEFPGRLHFRRRERGGHPNFIPLQVLSHPSHPPEGETPRPWRGGYVHSLLGWYFTILHTEISTIFSYLIN